MQQEIPSQSGPSLGLRWSSAGICSYKLPTVGVRKKKWKSWWAQAGQVVSNNERAQTKELNKFHFLQEQKRQSHSHVTERPPLFHGIPVVASQPLPTDLWWSCSLCTFKILESCTKRKSRKRMNHLMNVHHIRKSDAYLLNKGWNQPNSRIASAEAVRRRWKKQLERFKAVC